MEFASIFRIESRIIPEEQARYKKELQEATEAARVANYKVVHGKVTREDLSMLESAREYRFDLKGRRVPQERVVVLINKFRVQLPTW